MTPSPVCNRCRTPLAEGDPGLVPSWVVTAAALALAFGHAGMWVKEELSRPYCARCRTWIAPLALGIAALVLSIVVGTLTFAVKRIWKN